MPPLAEAFVRVRADTSMVGPDVRRGVGTAMSSVNTRAHGTALGKGVGKSFAGGFGSSASAITPTMQRTVRGAASATNPTGLGRTMGRTMGGSFAGGLGGSMSTVGSTLRTRMTGAVRSINGSSIGGLLGRNMGQGVTRSFGSQVRGIGSSLLKPLAMAGLAFGGVAIFRKFITDARASRRESALTANGIAHMGNVAGISAAGVDRLSRSISDQTGINKSAVQAGANLLLTFGNIRNQAGKGNDVFNQATLAVQNMSVRFSQDGKRSAIQLGKALQDPVKGVTALRRIGVMFTESQTKQIETLVKSGRTLEAQKIILAEVNRETGGAAEATASGWKKLKVQFTNFGIAVGNVIVPAINKVAGGLAERIPGAIKYVTDQWGMLVEAFNTPGWEAHGTAEVIGVVLRGLADLITTYVLPALAAFGGFLRGTVIPALANLVAFVGRNLAFFGPFAGFVLVIVAAMKAWALAQALLNAVMAASPVGLIVIALAAIGAGLVLAYQRSAAFRGIVQAVFGVARTIFAALVPVVMGLGRAFLSLAGFVGRNLAFFGPFVGTLAALVGVVLAFLGVARLIIMVTRAWTAAQALLGIVMNASLLPFILIGVAIAALVGGLVLAYQRSATFRAIVQAAFAVIGAVANWLWNTVLKPMFAGLVIYFRIVMFAVRLYLSVWVFVFKAVAAVAMWLWNNVLRPYFGLIAAGFRGVGVVFGVVRGIIVGVSNAVAATFRWLWNTVLRPIFDALKRAWDAVGSAFRAVKNNVIVPVIRVIVGTFLWLVGMILGGAAKAFGWIGPLGGKLRSANRSFQDFRKGVNSELDRIKDEDVKVTYKFQPLSSVAPRNRARGGPIFGPGSETSDSIPALLSNNEHVLSAREVRGLGGHKAVEQMRAMARNGGLTARFAIGGRVDTANINTFGAYTGRGAVEARMRRDKAALQRMANEMFLAPPVGVGVNRWAGMVASVLVRLGMPMGWTGAVLRRINQESGGNPYAVNRWDSNWRAGHPSVGLMQVIAGTFRAYAGRYRAFGPFMYGVSINPTANTYAGLNYAQHRYGRGNVPAVMVRAGGYDRGGLLPTGMTLAWNGTGRPERVTPAGADSPIVFNDCTFVGGSEAHWEDVFVKAYDRAKGKGRLGR